MLVVCSDIHVLGSLLMSAVVTRMQDLAPEFSKVFGGDTLGPPQREGATPCCTHPSLACGRARGGSAPVLGPKPWSPSTFQLWLRRCSLLELKYGEIRIVDNSSKRATEYHFRSNAGKRQASWLTDPLASVNSSDLHQSQELATPLSPAAAVT